MIYVSFPGGTMVKNLPADTGDAKDKGSIHGLGRSPEVGMEITSVFMPEKSHGQRSLEGYSSGVAKVRHDWSHTHSVELGMFGLLCSAVKNLPTNAGDAGLISGLGRSPEGGNVNLLQYSCLGNPMDRGAWQTTVHRVTNSQARLSN